jgi:hypothetical protein
MFYRKFAKKFEDFRRVPPLYLSMEFSGQLADGDREGG